MRLLMHRHLLDHYRFHGEFTGVRTARKHVGWYLCGMPDSAGFLQRFNQLDDAQAQLDALDEFLCSAQTTAAGPMAANDARARAVSARSRVA
jgi:tRNA-dihydrouridine synthase B